METLAERITFALQHTTKKNQSDLARFVKIKPPSVNAWLSGDTKTIRGTNLLRAAEFLGVHPLWLSHGEGPIFVDKAKSQGEAAVLCQRIKELEVALALAEARINKLQAICNLFTDAEIRQALDRMSSMTTDELEKRQ